MNRRHFLQSLALGGVALGLDWARPGKAWAAETDQLLIQVHASGGWDTTSLCDPKGDIPFDEQRGLINRFSQSDIRQAGNLRYAPVIDPEYAGTDHLDRFFSEQYAHTRIYNGLDFGTNGHSDGTYMATSGSHSELQPVLAALKAAPYADALPMAYFLGGGHGQTGGLVPATRFTDSSLIDRLTEPNPYLPTGIFDLIRQQHAAQVQDLLGQGASPARARNLANFVSAHGSNNQLLALKAKLPEEQSSGARRSAEIAAAALAAGVSRSASLESGGFDSHGNHDEEQNSALQTYFEMVNYLIAELDRHGIADRTLIVLSSDFGRTPYYNSGNGKDHWSTGSMMLWSRQIAGNRVIGQSDDQVRPMAVDPQTLEPSANGVILTPTHLHVALREYVGLAGSEIDRQFPLGVTPLALLS